jgi:uncharacterized membrane protein
MSKNDTPQIASKPGGMRLYALDLARFIAMIMMMQGHTLDALVSNSWIDVQVFPWNLWNFIRGLTAPVFLMVSGAVHVFAMKRGNDGAMSAESRKKRLRWAFFLLMSGYLLIFPANRIFDLPFLEPQVWRHFFQANILQLTSITLVLVVWLSSITFSVRSLGIWSFIASLVIFLLTPFIQSISWFTFLPEFFGSLLSYSHGSLFPLFPFSGFMFMGVAIGSLLYQMKAEQRDIFLSRHIFAVSGIALFVSAILMAIVSPAIPLPTGDYMMTDPAFMILRISIILSLFGICHHLYRQLPDYGEIFTFFSGKSLHIYILHLVLIYGTPWFSSIGRIAPKALDLQSGILAAIAVISLTLGLIWMQDKVQQRSNQARRIIRYSFGTILLYALLK